MHRLTLVGVNHKTAPLSLREKISFTEAEINEALLALKRTAAQGEGAYLDECVIVSTCNRTEIVGVTNVDIFSPKVLERLLFDLKGLADTELRPHIYHFTGREAAEHLFRVASGLESMVLGEHQISGQVKRAYNQAVACRMNGTVTNKLFHAAFRVAKQVRTKTRIGCGSTSVSQVACDLISHHVDDLATQNALVIGAGETAAIAARDLAGRGVAHMTITNRSFKRADELAADLDADVAVWENLRDTLTEADIVLCATASPSIVLDQPMMAEVMGRREGRPLYLVDLAVPRDVDDRVALIEGIHLFNIDDLQSAIEDNVERRGAAKHAAFDMIDEALEQFDEWLRTQRVAPAITELRAMAERIRTEEINKLRGLIDDEAFERVDAASRTIMNRILHTPIMSLKKAAMENNIEKLDSLLRSMNQLGA